MKIVSTANLKAEVRVEDLVLLNLWVDCLNECHYKCSGKLYKIYTNIILVLKKVSC